jgi:hypothetical protein
MKKIILFLLIVAGTSNGTDMGVSAASFLSRGYSARMISLGNAGIASVSDVSALHYNSAGIVNKGGLSSQATYFNNLLGNDYSDFSYIQLGLLYSSSKPIVRSQNIFLAFGIGFMGYGVNDIDYYDLESNYLSTEQFYEYAMTGSIAVKWFHLHMGIKYLFINQNFGGVIHSSNLESPLDFTGFGIQFKPYSWISFGMVLQDSIKVGPYDLMNKYSIAGITLHYKIKGNGPYFDLSIDSNIDRYHLSLLNLGLESAYKAFFLRLGIADIPMKDEIGDLRKFYGLNTKLGVGLGVKMNNMRFDLAYQKSLNDGFGNAYFNMLAFTIGFLK